MPDRMPEDMPDRMPEDMSDRMPEDLPVTKCINVMVGITRSKVIFATWWFAGSANGWKLLEPKWLASLPILTKVPQRLRRGFRCSFGTCLSRCAEGRFHWRELSWAQEWLIWVDLPAMIPMIMCFFFNISMIFHVFLDMFVYFVSTLSCECSDIQDIALDFRLASWRPTWDGPHAGWTRAHGQTCGGTRWGWLDLGKHVSNIQKKEQLWWRSKSLGFGMFWDVSSFTAMWVRPGGSHMNGMSSGWSAVNASVLGRLEGEYGIGFRNSLIVVL